MRTREEGAIPMEDRAMIEKHLALAEVHVAQGEGHIARQREIVAKMERDSNVDAAETARQLLATFEMTQRSHVGDRDRLRAELAACK
jgi:hypothetical protein